MKHDIGTLGALGRNRSFLIYTVGNVISLIGTWMQRILVGWLAWEMTGSGMWLGLIAAADLLPTVVIAPFAGAVADRWKRLTIAKISQTLGMIQALALAGLFGLGMLSIELLFLLALAQGAVTAVNQPARLALIHSLVGKELIPPAVAVNSVVFNLARLLGPMAAGVAIVSIGIGWGFFLNALSFGVFIVSLMLVRLESAEMTVRRQSFLRQTADGILYTLKHRGIAGVLLLMLAMGLGVRPIADLLPGYVATVLSSDATGLVALTSVMALGGILGSVLMTGFYDRSRIPNVVMLNSVGVALSVIVLIFVSDLLVSLPLFAAFGFFKTRASIAAQVYVQLAAGDEMRGRVLSLHGMIQRGGPAFGALIIGAAADFAGFRWPVLLGCILLLGCIVYVGARRSLDDLDKSNHGFGWKRRQPEH